MRIATWNINGLRARLEFVLHWLEARRPDVVGLQELYAEHPALDGRVGIFLIVDPLGRRIKAELAFDGGQHGTHVLPATVAGVWRLVPEVWARCPLKLPPPASVPLPSLIR